MTTTFPLDGTGHPADGGYTPAVGVATLQTGTQTTDGAGTTSAPLNVVVVPDVGAFHEISALSAGYFGAYLVPVTDISSYKWWSLHITGAYNGTLTFQISNDGLNWDLFPAMQLNTPGQFVTSVTNQTGVYGGPVVARYLSVQMVSYATGIATGTLELFTMSPALPWAMAPGGIKVDGSGVVQPVTITSVQTQLPVLDGTLDAKFPPASSDGQVASTVSLVATGAVNSIGAIDRILADLQSLRVNLFVKSATLGDTAILIGQQTMAASLPVAIASDQTSLPVNAYASLVDGSKTVTTAGTRVQLTSSATPMKRVSVVAMSNNTGIITVGGSGVVASQGTRKGLPLSAGSGVDILVNDLSKVYIDATVNGEGVTYVYYN